MAVILANKRVLFTDDGRLEVFAPKLATKLNRFLKKYDNGNYMFQPGEECFFNIPQIEINDTLQAFLVKKPSQKQQPSLEST